MKKSPLRTILLTTSFFFTVLGYSKTVLVEGTIEKTVDGDTVWVQPSRREGAETRMKIRMLGMDAPETHLPSPHGVVGQGRWGDAATEYMADLAPVDSDIELEDHGKDMYKRTLGRLFYDGDDVNLRMVKSGWAITYIICSGRECRPGFFEAENVADYVAACEYAKKKGLGVFNPADPLREMPFEFRLRMQNRKPDKYVGNFETKELFEPEDYKKVPLCKRIFFMKETEANRVGYYQDFSRRLPLIGDLVGNVF